MKQISLYLFIWYNSEYKNTNRKSLVLEEEFNKYIRQGKYLMIKPCRSCIFNFKGFCEKTYMDDLDEVLECNSRIPKFDLAFYYDENTGDYRCIAYLPNEGNEIIRSTKISHDTILKMLDREDKHLKSNNSILDKIK